MNSKRRISRLMLLVAVLAGISWGNPTATEGGQDGTADPIDARVQTRTYVFPETGQSIPYSLFVPSNYDASQEWPLIVALHAAGRSNESWLVDYAGMVDLAEQDGYIVASPLGYHPRGYYGSLGPGQATQSLRQAGQLTDDLPPNLGELSEQDVMNVFRMVQRRLSIDDDRIYLLGHSMGGLGTLHLASEYPDIWAGIAVVAPGSQPIKTDWTEQIEKLTHIPTFIIQGDQDTYLPVSRGVAATMSELGMPHVYLVIEGGDHTRFIMENPEMLSKVYSFFNIVHKNQRPQPE
jgi:predicted peptidase